MAEKYDVFVGNLTFNTTEEQLREKFSFVGPVKNIRILTDKDTGKPKGFAFVEYFDANTALSAIRHLDQAEMNSRRIKVGYPANSNLKDMARQIGQVVPESSADGLTTGPLSSASALAARQQLEQNVIANLKLHEAWDILEAVKKLVSEDGSRGTKAKTMLENHPQLVGALYEIQKRLGIALPANIVEQQAQQAAEKAAAANKPVVSMDTAPGPPIRPANARQPVQRDVRDVREQGGGDFYGAGGGNGGNNRDRDGGAGYRDSRDVRDTRGGRDWDARGGGRERDSSRERDGRYGAAASGSNGGRVYSGSGGGASSGARVSRFDRPAVQNQQQQGRQYDSRGDFNNRQQFNSGGYNGNQQYNNDYDQRDSYNNGNSFDQYGDNGFQQRRQNDFYDDNGNYYSGGDNQQEWGNYDSSSDPLAAADNSPAFYDTAMDVGDANQQHQFNEMAIDALLSGL